MLPYVRMTVACRIPAILLAPLAPGVVVLHTNHDIRAYYVLKYGTPHLMRRDWYRGRHDFQEVRHACYTSSAPADSEPGDSNTAHLFFMERPPPPPPEQRSSGSESVCS